MKIVMATNNQNKLKEAREIFDSLGIAIISQKEAGITIEPEENGKTFAENALIKAHAVYDLLKCPVIADDSGLCVDALDGRPNVYSARYAPEGQQCEKLLQELENIPENQRTAQFVTVIAFLDENGKEILCEGVCQGAIGFEKKGTNGFGYDPVFLYQGKSFAELSADEKNAISHRGIALRKLYEILKERSLNHAE
ncbi:MAG: RdgB/HAM1 family non-canonical purine NTP pyrophosphatase [Oscillospiraceae bacterium]|nr:RdgB/HAM1 family non-canonical purine NTP pyrophosphatase [Oscillospiraceae bacterium]